LINRPKPAPSFGGSDTPRPAAQFRQGVAQRPWQFVALPGGWPVVLNDQPAPFGLRAATVRYACTNAVPQGKSASCAGNCYQNKQLPHRARDQSLYPVFLADFSIFAARY
jgi:hypothetical protein